MLHGYRQKEWYFFSKTYLPQIKNMFGYKPFRISDIKNDKIRSVFDDVFLGGGIEIVSSCMVNGKRDYIFRVYSDNRRLSKGRELTHQDYINMVSYLSKTFKGKPFYLEDIPNNGYRLNFYKYFEQHLPGDSNRGYSINYFDNGIFTDKNGVKHDCFYVPYPIIP